MKKGETSRYTTMFSRDYCGSNKSQVKVSIESKKEYYRNGKVHFVSLANLMESQH
jgi:hypothetical protein